MSPLKLRPEKEKAPSRPKDVHHPTQCTSCKQLFTIVVRKHHCVSCHDVFCGKCSKIRAHSEQGELMRQRYCVLCEKEHADRNTMRNGMRIRQRASISEKALSFSEIKKLMKAPPLPGPVNDHPLTPISASFGRPPPGGRAQLRRRSTKSLMNETISSCNTDMSEPLTPDVSFIETECSVITGDTSFLGTESSSRDMSSQLELDLLDLSDIEQVDELQDTPIEPYAGYTGAETGTAHTPVYNALCMSNMASQSEPRSGQQVQFTSDVKNEKLERTVTKRMKRERRARSDSELSEADSSICALKALLYVAVALVALFVVYQVVWYGLIATTSSTTSSGGNVYDTTEESSLYSKWSRAVGSSLQPIAASVHKVLYRAAPVYTYNTYNTYTIPAEPATVFNIVLQVEKKNAFQSFSGLLKKVVHSAVGPLAEGLRDVDEIYI